jgi:hypothetical protein
MPLAHRPGKPVYDQEKGEGRSENGEQGTENGEQGTGNGEQGTEKWGGGGRPVLSSPFSSLQSEE